MSTLLVTDNYPVWAMKMKVNMCAQRVWGALDLKGKDKEVDDKVDQGTLAITYQAMPDAMMH